MTRKDYEAIAATFDRVFTRVKLTRSQRIGVGAVAFALAQDFEDESETFDPEKFLTACGVK